MLRVRGVSDGYIHYILYTRFGVSRPSAPAAHPLCMTVSDNCVPHKKPAYVSPPLNCKTRRPRTQNYCIIVIPRCGNIHQRHDIASNTIRIAIKLENRDNTRSMDAHSI